MPGGDLHPLGDRARTHVEGAAEDARECKHVVDLVRVVRAPGRDDGDLPRRKLLGGDLGGRVRHREHDRVVGHPLHARTADRARHGEPDEDVRAVEDVVRLALQAIDVRALREGLLDRVQADTAVEDGAAVIAADHIADTGIEEDVGHGDTGCADPRHHDLHVLDLLADHLERIQQRREDDDRRAVLIVVEDGDVELRPQPLLDLEAPGCRDVLQVDPPEAGGDCLDDGHDLVGVLRVEAERPGVDVAELLEQQRLPLHHRHRRLGADVAEAQHGGAVRDDRDGVLLDRQVPGRIAILVNRHADARHTGRVGHREVVTRLDRHLRLHLDLAPEVHQERAVGDPFHLHPVQAANVLDDPVQVIGIGRVDRDVADLRPLLDPDEVDRPERAPCIADRAGEACEGPGGVVESYPDGGTERS